ncbi:MAG: recombinase A [Proteobacteria bacterium]|nr:recombinase A [Pseudomonadota bacterium]
MPNPAHTLGDLIAAKYLRLGDAPLQPSWESRWNRAGLRGRLVELSGRDASAALTAAFGLVLDAQRERETVVWVTSQESSFFPPDAAEGDVDLDILPVVRVPLGAVPRATDKLARSGAFGLIVIDCMSVLNRRGGGVPSTLLSRLLGLAQKHDIAVVFLTRNTSATSSLGSLVSLRGEARHTRVGADRHEVEVRVLKDKHCAPGWSHAETCRGPAGLR